LGSRPRAIARGAGAGARRSIGTAVVSGMLTATLIGIFLIPVFYVVMQRIGERHWPFRSERETAEPQGVGAPSRNV
jgi:Cu/Ag efflux pump CusA